MNRFRYFAPSLVLIVLTGAVLMGGPHVARELAWAEQAARIELARDRLAGMKTSKLAELGEAFREVARVTEPSVVHIEVAKRIGLGLRPDDAEIPADPFHEGVPATPEELRRWFEQRRSPDFDTPEAPQSPADPRGLDVPEPVGNGSGWVYTDGKHIVTNLHVVKDADVIKVRFFDKTERLARIVGADEQTDIAVLAVDGDPKLHPAKLATEPVEQGDMVFAFGSPFQFDFSMSQGIVSGKGRRLGILGATGYESYIQTDAAINPGNSGGPLTNIYAEVVGMNSAIATRSGGNQGIGFAIPVPMIRAVVTQLIEQGKVRRGYMGVGIKTLSEKMAASFDYEGRGVLITRVEPGMPAAAAGIEAGDILVEVEGREVASADDLRNVVAAFPPDTEVKIKVYRSGKVLDKTMKLADQAASPWVAGPGAVPTPGGPEAAVVDALSKLGIERVRAVGAAAAAKLGVDSPGVLVERVRAHSVAATEGIRPGSVIVAVMDTPVKTVEELVAELNKHDLKEGVRVRIKEKDFEDFVMLTMP